jgi:hypothetical protein
MAAIAHSTSCCRHRGLHGPTPPAPPPSAVDLRLAADGGVPHAQSGMRPADSGATCSAEELGLAAGGAALGGAPLTQPRSPRGSYRCGRPPRRYPCAHAAMSPPRPHGQASSFAPGRQRPGVMPPPPPVSTWTRDEDLPLFSALRWTSCRGVIDRCSPGDAPSRVRLWYITSQSDSMCVMPSPRSLCLAVWSAHEGERREESAREAGGGRELNCRCAK